MLSFSDEMIWKCMSTDVSFSFTTNRPIRDLRFRDKLPVCDDKNIPHSVARQTQPRNFVKVIFFKHTQSKEEISIDDRPSAFPRKIFV